MASGLTTFAALLKERYSGSALPLTAVDHALFHERCPVCDERVRLGSLEEHMRDSADAGHAAAWVHST